MYKYNIIQLISINLTMISNLLTKSIYIEYYNSIVF
jgi:hypothetical protein